MFGKAAYIFGVAERVLGVGEESWILAVLDGRYVAGYVRRPLVPARWHHTVTSALAGQMAEIDSRLSDSGPC